RNDRGRVPHQHRPRPGVPDHHVPERLPGRSDAGARARGRADGCRAHGRRPVDGAPAPALGTSRCLMKGGQPDAPYLASARRRVGAVRAMAAGSVDVAGSALESIVGAVAQGADTKVISSYQVANDFAFVVGPSIQKLSDLQGKRVNIESAGSITDALSRLVLKKAKVDPSQVQFV